MEERTASLEAASADAPRVIAIVTKGRVVEVWHVQRQRTEYRQQETELPAEIQTRVVNGRQERRDVRRIQRARQEWGHLIIRRHQATSTLRWAPSIGLMMLIPGTLLAAGSANHGKTEPSLTLLILQSALIIFGGLLAIGSGWRLVARRLQLAEGMPLESLGVSACTLGLPSGVVALEPMPAGYCADRFKSEIEVDLPMGSWTVVEEFETNYGWYRAC